MGIFDFLKRDKGQPQTLSKPMNFATKSERSMKEQPSSNSTDYLHSTRKPAITVSEGWTVEPAHSRNLDAIASKRGLYPSETLVLHYAPSFKMGGNSFQKFWLYSYGIEDVQSVLSSLLKRGFICEGDLKSILDQQTVPELKKLLLEHGCKVTGKKDDLVSIALSEIAEDKLMKIYPHRPYELTSIGHDEVKENEYIIYIHRNKFQDLDIWSLNRLIHTEPKFPYRDRIWGYLNERSLKHYYNHDFGFYINCRLDMATFLKQENKYDRALEMYAEAIYYDLSGIHNGLNLDENYRESFLRNNFPYKENIDKVYPGMIQRIEDCQKKLKCSDDELKTYLMSGMSITQLPFHPFTINECVQIILLQREKNIDAIRIIYMKARTRLK